MANRHRHPRRGPRDGRNVLISGDVPGDLGSRQPQGGARPLSEEYRESGNLEAREFGVPQADIPGGVRHIVSPETTPHYPPGVYERPADYHKYHGVESDDGQYYPPPGDVARPRDVARVPKIEDAVPVYILEGAGNEKRIRALITEGPMAFATGTTDPFRLADRDPRRVKFWICNETTPAVAGGTGPGVRIGSLEDAADNRGLLVPAGQIKDFNTQAAVYMTNQSGSSVTLSWGYETEIPAAGTGT